MSVAGSSAGADELIIPAWVENLRTGNFPHKNLAEGFPRDPPPYTTRRVEQFHAELQELWTAAASFAERLAAVEKERDDALAQVQADLNENIRLTHLVGLLQKELKEEQDKVTAGEDAITTLVAQTYAPSESQREKNARIQQGLADAFANRPRTEADADAARKFGQGFFRGT
jgi:hypothetical protein